MKRSVKALFLTVCMTALATAPIVTITTIATADAAYAKPGNSGGGKGGGNSSAGGKGNGKDKASGAKGKGKSSGAKGKGAQFKQKGKGNGKSHWKTKSKGNFDLAKTPGGKKIKGFFDRITGQDSKPTRTVKARAYTAPETLPEDFDPPKRPRYLDVEDIPRNQLGNMNASLNANFNAVLAHIRNGNDKGPIGAFAALAVATKNAEYAQEIDHTARAYDKAAELLGDEYSDKEDPTSEDIVLAYIDSGDENEAVDKIIDWKLRDVDGSLKEYPSNEKLEYAAYKLNDLEDAQDHVLETWNKSDEATRPETKAVLRALDDRIEENLDAIDDAIDESDTYDRHDYDYYDDDVVCDALECEDEIDDVALAD